METTGLFTVLAGVALLVVAIIGTLVLAVWFSVAGIDRTDVYWWIWGVACGVPLVGGVVLAVGSRRRVDASFADGHVSVGRVDRVIEQPGGGDDTTWYELRISAELADGVVLCRKLHRDGNDPSRRTGGLIRFRHNSLDPDDLHDVLFDGWPDPSQSGQTTGVGR